MLAKLHNFQVKISIKIGWKICRKKKKWKIGLRDSLKRRTASSAAVILAIDDPSKKKTKRSPLWAHIVRTRTITLSLIHSGIQPFSYSVILSFVYVDKTVAPALNAVLSYCLPRVLWIDIHLIWIFAVPVLAVFPTIYVYDCRFLGL